MTLYKTSQTSRVCSRTHPLGPVFGQALYPRLFSFIFYFLLFRFRPTFTSTNTFLSSPAAYLCSLRGATDYLPAENFIHQIIALTRFIAKSTTTQAPRLIASLLLQYLESTRKLYDRDSRGVWRVKTMLNVYCINIFKSAARYSSERSVATLQSDMENKLTKSVSAPKKNQEKKHLDLN